ncbi:MAG: hypothetical protein ACM3YO_07520 [Bacteroidota bacterium]
MKKLLAACLAFSCITLAGCGTTASAPTLSKSTETDSADATHTLKKSFRALHKAIFAKIDANSDKYIDEYEAGQYISLKDITNMDKNHDGKISYRTFMEYATKTTFLGFIPWGNDTDIKFMKRIRDQLAWVFKKLDTNNSWLLEEKEMTKTALKKMALGFSYDNLRIKLDLDFFTPDEIKAADKTGDGNLSQAEFEDLYMNKVIALLNPQNVNPEPTPAPSVAPSVAPSAAPVQ